MAQTLLVLADKQQKISETMNEDIELLRFLARLKLQVRRELDQSVDLDRLKNEPDYARQRLAEIEEATADEDLLVLVLRLREMLVPRVSAAPSAAAEPVRVSSEQRYLYGARS